ncbi:CRTAC1 family protein [Actinocrinis sp.]|uniref:CRTAC1 family protein n=1 Tax=Actinocrinis sp. TaxID=1920516 RepID=UPI0039C87439
MIPGALTILIAAALWFAGEAAVAVGGGAETAAKYKFTQMNIALPPGYNDQHMNTIRQVNPAYQKIQSWISSVGAAIAINDVTGHGRSDGMCIVDTRTNEVIVTYTPTAPSTDQFTPFVLDPSPLPVDNTMAPTSCTPGDFNGDGRTDFMVTYLGRTPILYLAKAGVSTPSVAAYQPQELVPNNSIDGKYHGPKWQTDASYVGDLDGTGHPSIIIGNYFPDSDVLNPNGENNVSMNNTMSSARNGGGDHVLQWYSATGGAKPSVQYVENETAIPYADSTGWALAISGADLTGQGLPDIYIANDFGHGHLMYNESTPGNIKFIEATGNRTPATPKSFVLGNGSFKGMGVDFGDVNHNGKFDIFVSAITSRMGLEESNYMYINQAANNAEMQKDLASQYAPFQQEAQQYGVAWTGWAWDAKMDDFLNDGNLEIIQTDGFIKGNINRWNWAQELAIENDDLLVNPAMWPNFEPGDDVAGHEALAFYARNSSSTYVNVALPLGLAVQTPTRGVATGDTQGNGVMDFAIARQWGPPAFYANQSPNQGNYVDLELYRPSVDAASTTGTSTTSAATPDLANIGTPAYGATVTLTTPEGSQISKLDGGGGHDSYRSFDVHFGLGKYSGPATAKIEWRDSTGTLHTQTFTLMPGTHSFMLTNAAQEVTSR